MAGRPIFHEQTSKAIERLASHMPHALGLFGEKGVGLTTIATQLAGEADAEVIPVYPEKTEKGKPKVDLEKGSITIEIIRRLYGLTQGKSTRRRCIIIEAADTMGAPAQNAFLKLLEEPTNNTTFILLVHQPNVLLPTVRSRLQMQQVVPITAEQSGMLLDRLGVTDATKRAQLLFLASGLPARLTQLATDEKAFETEAGIMRQARTFVQGSLYERLVVAHSVKSARETAQSLVTYAMNILQRTITEKHVADDETVQLLDRLETAVKRLEGNGNSRLVLAAVVLG